MLFSDMTLEKVIMEFRFDTTFLFWDNSGKALAKIVSKYPRFELRDAKLSNVNVDWWDEGISFNLSHERSDVTVDYPQSLDTYKGVADSMVQTLQDLLEVKVFKRVGLRFILAYPFESKDKARDFLAKLGVISYKPGALEHFVDGTVEEQQLMFRYEGKDRGVLSEDSDSSLLE
jgi:hypothetical protein